MTEGPRVGALHRETGMQGWEARGWVSCEGAPGVLGPCCGDAS